ncbi:MAG: DUF1294 domain-containing protein [Clostridia bacterium]|nr:DUF1294 domain-containing protein [Clostridia bacterium]
MDYIAELLNSVSTKNLIIYLLVINCIGFLAMGLDKFYAKKDMWRTPEKTLFTLCLLGGGFGTILGMYLFRHKTKKLYFTVGMPTILICEIIAFVYLKFFYI